MDRFIVIGTRWISGLAIQTPTAFGPFQGVNAELDADRFANKLDESGYVEVDVLYLEKPELVS